MLFDICSICTGLRFRSVVLGERWCVPSCGVLVVMFGPVDRWCWVGLGFEGKWKWDRSRVVCRCAFREFGGWEGEEEERGGGNGEISYTL